MVLMSFMQGKSHHLKTGFYRIILCLALWLGGIAAGCSSLDVYNQDTATPTTTATESIQATATATIDWFPSTSTLTQAVITAQPSITTTLEPPPSLGSLIFKDNFSDKSLWLAGQFQAGIIAYGDQELSLAISQAGGVLISTRKEPAGDNFYLMVTATPSLCLSDDYYGVQFREADEGDFYRYVVSCSGKIRLERWKGGVGLLLLDWTPSAQAFPNNQRTYQLGVWAVGSQLKIYLNNVLQFSTTDSSVASGGWALYARSMGKTAVTISFSNLSVYQARK